MKVLGEADWCTGYIGVSTKPASGSHLCADIEYCSPIFCRQYWIKVTSCTWLHPLCRQVQRDTGSSNALCWLAKHGAFDDLHALHMQSIIDFAGVGQASQHLLGANKLAPHTRNPNQIVYVVLFLGKGHHRNSQAYHDQRLRIDCRFKLSIWLSPRELTSGGL